MQNETQAQKFTVENIETLVNKGFSVDKHETKGRIYIGIRYPKHHVWHWFVKYESSEYLFFSESYSQNTGKSIKSTIHGLNVQKYIESKISAEYEAKGGQL